jgi:hypothetical protein
VVQRALNRRKTWARGTLASRGSRADPHYHIVTTFEAKESGAPGVLAQSLGISGRSEWLSEVWVEGERLGDTRISGGSNASALNESTVAGEEKVHMDEVNVVFGH